MTEHNEDSTHTAATGVGEVGDQAGGPLLAVVAARAADGKGATDIAVLDVASVSGFASYFVIATGGNDRQVKAIVEAVEEAVGLECGDRPQSIEGMDTRDWVLMNYGYALVHVFSVEARGFYDLERLWRDADRLDW